MSQHGFDCPMEVGVATPFFEVATWVFLVEQKGGRDMGLTSGPGLVVQKVATCALDLSARRALAARATYARPACCARSSTHDMGTACATWVLGVHIVHPTQFCDSTLFKVTVWTLFMDTVHRVKKKFKIFLGGDLIYEIFILHLLLMH